MPDSSRLFLGSDGLRALRTLVGGDPRGFSLAFVPTGANPLGETGAALVRRDVEQLEAMGFSVEPLRIENASKSEIEETLGSVDGVFVEGGSVFYLLDQVLASGFADLLPTALSAGKVYAGVSGGAMILAPDLEPWTVTTTEDQASVRSTKALGVVDFLPHSDARGERYTRLMAEFGERFTLIPLSDWEAVLVEGGAYRVVPS